MSETLDATNTLVFFLGFRRQKKKRNPYRILLSVRLSAKNLFLRKALRYRFEIKTLYSGLESLEAVKISNFYVTIKKIRNSNL